MRTESRARRGRAAAWAIGLAASTLWTNGCITVGKSFRPDAVQLIRIGVTTRAQVEEQLGPPWRTGVEDGRETWTYGHYRYSAFGPARTRDFVLRFDERGVVTSYTYSSTDPQP